MGAASLDALFSYLIPIGAVLAALLAIATWRTGTSQRVAWWIAGCWLGPWLLLALTGLEGVEWMFQLVAEPSKWDGVGPVWISPFIGAALLIAAVVKWKRGIVVKAAKEG
jgi:hypothetical protein